MELTTAQDFLIKSLSAVTPLSDALKQAILKQAILKKFKFKEEPRRTRIKQPDYTNRYLCFVVQGLVKGAYQQEHKEYILWFAKEGQFALLPDSFFPQVATDEYIEAIEDCWLFRISHQDLESLYGPFPEMERLARLALRQQLVDAGRRNRMLRLSTSNARLHHFIMANPGLAARLSRQDIAAYLSISPSTFYHSGT